MTAYGMVSLAHAKVWHWSESEIAGDAITRCGRRLRDDSARGPLLRQPEGSIPWDRRRPCAICVPATPPATPTRPTP